MATGRERERSNPHSSSMETLPQPTLNRVIPPPQSSRGDAPVKPVDHKTAIDVSASSVVKPASETKEKKSDLLIRECPFIPSGIDITKLNKDLHFYSEEEIKAIRTFSKRGKYKKTTPDNKAGIGNASVVAVSMADLEDTKLVQSPLAFFSLGATCGRGNFGKGRIGLPIPLQDHKPGERRWRKERVVAIKQQPIKEMISYSQILKEYKLSVEVKNLHVFGQCIRIKPRYKFVPLAELSKYQTQQERDNKIFVNFEGDESNKKLRCILYDDTTQPCQQIDIPLDKLVGSTGKKLPSVLNKNNIHELNPFLSNILNEFKRKQVGQAFHVFVMEYAHGESLFYFMENPKKLNSFQWIKLFGKLLRKVKALKDAGVIHCDLKPFNIKFDPITGEVKILDFGMSKKVLFPHWKGVWDINGGSPRYMAPEIYNQSLNTRVLFTYQIDAYSIGITLAEMLNLVFLNNKGRLTFYPRGDRPKNNYQLSALDESDQLEIYHLLKDLTATEVEDRITIDMAITRWDKIEAKLIEAQFRPVVIIDVLEYLNIAKTPGELSESLVNALKHFKEVVLVDSTNSVTDLQLARVRQILEANFIAVNEDVFCPKEKMKLHDLILQTTYQFDKNKIPFSFFYIGKALPDLSDTIMQVTSDTPNLPAVISSKAKAAFITTNMREKVSARLDAEIVRLRKKIKPGDIDEKRIVALQQAKADIANPEKLKTVAQLDSRLVDLKETQQKTRFRGLYKFYAESGLVVQTIKDDLDTSLVGNARDFKPS